MIDTKYHVFFYSVSQDVFHNFFDNVIYVHVPSVLYYEKLPEYHEGMV